MIVKALISFNPSEVARKSETYESVVCLDVFVGIGAPSKKKGIGTSIMWDSCCKRLALMRLVPFSYF